MLTSFHIGQTRETQMIEIPEFFVNMVSGRRRMGLKNSRAEKESGTPHSAAGDVGINRMMVAFFLADSKEDCDVCKVYSEFRSS